MDVTGHLDTAAACAIVGAVLGWFVPRLVAWIPEPTEPGDKLTYAELGATPGLAWKTALASGLASGLLGLAVGWDWSLGFLLYLCPVGVALGYVDFRTRLLPTRLIAPSYLVVVLLVLAAAGLERDPGLLLGAALGWLAFGLLYWLLWRFTPGMGYGDVRLSGVLGLALGYLGGTALMAGLYAGFVVGVVGWVPLRLLRITKDRHYPFGPFMLVGAVVGVLYAAYA